MKKALCGLALLTVLGLALLPSPIDPLPWHAPQAPTMTGVLEPNDSLMKAELISHGQIHGPEDTAVDAHGRLYAGLADGRIINITDDAPVTLANTGGRPLGMAFDAGGNLIVADAYKGLLSVDPAGNIRVLSTHAGGQPLIFADDLDIGADGTVYFSDASSRFQQPDYLLDLLEARPHGRLLAYSASTGQTQVLLENLYFANGVTLSPAEDYLLVTETYRYRITRYWLKGDKAGTHEVFSENLPGMPDNLQGDGKGLYWVALATPRSAIVDTLHRYPWLKAQMAKLPRALWPKAAQYGLIIALDESGQIVRSLHDPSGSHLKMITSVKPVGDVLYLGSLDNDRIGKLELR